MRQLAQLGFPAIGDALQALVTAAEALRQPSAARQAVVRGAASVAAAAVGINPAAAAAATDAVAATQLVAAGYSSEEWPNAAEWPDMAAAAAAAPCSIAYWARHVQRELCVQHCVDELRRRLQLFDAALAECVRRGEGGSSASAAATGWAPAGLQGVDVAALEAEGLAELSSAQLRYLLQTTQEAGALALAQVHRPSAGGQWFACMLVWLSTHTMHGRPAPGRESHKGCSALLLGALFLTPETQSWPSLAHVQLLAG